MPRAKDNLKIVVAQLTEGDERIITVTIAAKAADFALPDLLSNQGAIDSYPSILSKAVKEATESYLQETKDAVAAIAGRKQGGQESASARSPKQPGAGKEGGPKTGTRPEEGTAAPVSRAVPERVNGSVAS
jgi:hypothetical protein